MSFEDPQFDPLLLSFGIDNDNSVQNISVRPFLHIDNHIIPIDRITEIGFVPVGIIYTSESTEYFNEVLARQDAHQRGVEVIEKKTPILLITHSDASGRPSYIHRHGNKAEELWKYIIDNLAFSV